MRRSFVVCAALSAALASSSPGLAESPQTNLPADEESRGLSGSLGEQSEAALASKEVHLNIVDKKLALSLAVDTHMQIEMAKLALESIRDDHLRTLLNERIRTQQTFADRLEQLTGGAASEAIADARRAILKDREGRNDQQGKFKLLSLQKNATAMLVRVRMEILDQYSQMVCAELEAKQAEAYDRHYLQADLLHQMQMLATLDVFAGQASADFADVINETAAAGRKQLADARRLWIEMEAIPLVDNTAKVPLVAETGTRDQ